VDNYAKELAKTNEKIEKEIKTSKDFIDNILPIYKNIIENPKEDQKEVNPERWVNGKIESLFKKTGVALEKTTQEIIIELNNRIHQNNISIEYNELDVLCKQYIADGRSIDKPLKKDLNWLNSRCKDHNISVDVFFNRCKEIRNSFGGNIIGQGD